MHVITSFYGICKKAFNAGVSHALQVCIRKTLVVFFFYLYTFNTLPINTFCRVMNCKLEKKKAQWCWLYTVMCMFLPIWCLIIFIISMFFLLPGSKQQSTLSFLRLKSITSEIKPFLHMWLKNISEKITFFFCKVINSAFTAKNANSGQGYIEEKDHRLSFILSLYIWLQIVFFLVFLPFCFHLCSKYIPLRPWPFLLVVEIKKAKHAWRSQTNPDYCFGSSLKVICIN